MLRPCHLKSVMFGRKKTKTFNKGGRTLAVDLSTVEKLRIIMISGQPSLIANHQREPLTFEVRYGFSSCSVQRDHSRFMEKQLEVMFGHNVDFEWALSIVTACSL